jgi:hypothetical protein
VTGPRGATLLAAAIAGTIAVRFAEPIHDGDLFWHMAYARQMLERGTLHLDHAAFSWMPEASDVIYCSWLSQLAFYALWGAPGRGASSRSGTWW